MSVGASSEPRCEFALGSPPAGEPEDRLGALAQALEARVAAAPFRPRESAEDAQVELFFRAEVLEPTERAAILAAAAGPVRAATSGSLTRARFAARALAELARAHAGAR
ncbi:MAG: hypothetical protein ABL998_21905 [Planctomycetota bacterium]